MGKSLKDRTADGLFWGGFSNGLVQVLGLCIGILLARKLMPSEYGLVGMLAIFTALANALQESGFGVALINRQKFNQLEYDSVFWFNVTVSFGLYVVLFFSAPLIASFFHSPELVNLSRFVFCGFLLSSLGIVPNAYLSKNLLIKKRSVISLSATIVSGVVGVILAYSGFSYWSLAIQSLLATAINVVFLWVVVPWKPKFHFDGKVIVEMFPFSVKVLLTSIFDIFKGNIISVILGRYYSKPEVGYFSQANKWSIMCQKTVSGMESAVAQPVLATVSAETDRQARLTGKIIRFTSFFTFPILFGMALISNEFISVAITDTWAESANLLRILCIGTAFTPIADVLSKLVLSRGKSNFFMWNVIVSGILQLVAMFLSSSFGMKTMVIVYTVINIVWTFSWTYKTWKEVNYGIINLLRDILPYAMLAAVVMVFVHFVTLSISNELLLLASRVFFAALLYLGTLYILGSEIMRMGIKYLLDKLRIRNGL